MADHTIKLGINDSDDSTFGFALTSSGREFLQGLFPSFHERLGYSFGKLATIVADKSITSDIAEINNTKQALKRWGIAGQNELWLKDPDKTLRVMTRLEVEMMRDLEIAEVLSDQAASIYKIDIGRSFSKFYYGASLKHASKAQIQEILDNSEGIFHVFHENIDGGGIGRFFDTGDIFTLSRPKGYEFLIAHEFKRLSVVAENRIVFRKKYSGYAFALPGRRIQRLLVSHSDPWERSIETLRPDMASHPYLDGYLPQNHYWVDVEISDVRDVERVGSRILRSVTTLLVPVSKEISPFLKKYVERSLWDLVL